MADRLRIGPAAGDDAARAVVRVGDKSEQDALVCDRLLTESNLRSDRSQQPAGGTALELRDAEQEMLCPDVVVPQRTRLVLREDDRLPGLATEALEQSVRP